MYRVIEKNLDTGHENTYNYDFKDKPWLSAERAAYDHACILQEMADWGGKNVQVRVERIS